MKLWGYHKQDKTESGHRADHKDLDEDADRTDRDSDADSTETPEVPEGPTNSEDLDPRH